MTSTTTDDRGFQKTELSLLNDKDPNFQDIVNLVDRNPCPNGLQLVNPDQSGKKNQFDLVELAQQIQTADQFTKATAGSKLSVIAEQVKFLQQQAQKVLEEASLNKEIHHIACNFKKVPGKIYYIYKKPGDNGKKYMSMISPEEWGKQCPEFVAAYKLEADMTWTPHDKIQQKNSELLMIDTLLNSNTPLRLQLN